MQENSHSAEQSAVKDNSVQRRTTVHGAIYQSMVQDNVLQCRTTVCSAGQQSPVQKNSLHCGTAVCSAGQTVHNAGQQFSPQNKSLQSGASVHNVGQQSAVQSNSLQYSAAMQYDSLQLSAVRTTHSSRQDNSLQRRTTVWSNPVLQHELLWPRVSKSNAQKWVTKIPEWTIMASVWACMAL
jgi:hypothetical protein